MATNEPGLRELKKQITREAIADAARQLALGNGLDHVTLDEIAHVLSSPVVRSGRSGSRSPSRPR